VFVRVPQPVPFHRERLLALCVSLNRPIVDVDPLPVGPARAAIAVHRSDAGEPALAIAVRTDEGGQVSAFAYEGPVHGSVEQALAVGLSFAESMGFLFDDDLVGQTAGAIGLAAIDAAAGAPRERGVDRAYALWCDLAGADPTSAAPGEPVPVPLSKFRRPEPPARAEPQRAERRASARGRDDAEAPEPETPAAPAELGRIQVVRRRVRDEAPRLDFAMRVLASF